MEVCTYPAEAIAPPVDAFWVDVLGVPGDDCELQQAKQLQHTAVFAVYLHRRPNVIAGVTGRKHRK